MSFLKKTIKKEGFMPTKRLQVTLSEVTHKRIEELRKTQGLTKSALITLAVNNLFENEKGEEKSNQTK